MMIFLYALLQAPIVLPRIAPQDPQPVGGMPTAQDLVQDRTFDYDLPGPLYDFLGRRHICADLATHPDPDAETEDQRRFLNCAALQREEAEWRRLGKGDAAIE
jgi:hypothetical protein